VFLDEIGEIDPSIQVKLLRVLQDRKFQRLGESADREFRGKIIAATNRDLVAEMTARRFRADLYYRLCADVVKTPSLHEQLTDAPDDLPNLVRFVVARVVGSDSAEQSELTEEVVAWIDSRLGRSYAWPGNFRELEQCVRNVMIRREYHPVRIETRDDASDMAKAVHAGDLTSDELLTEYYRLVYQMTGNYRAAARKLNVNWRTVRGRVVPRSAG
jgi:DNA-binding NtrC family response regulator